MGAGDRQSVPVEPDGHARDCVGDRTPQRRPGAVRGLHPDRRRHQSGQLRRRAHQRARRADRDQHRYLQPERRVPGHRIRRAEQPRPQGVRRAAEIRRGATRVDWLRRDHRADDADGGATRGAGHPRRGGDGLRTELLRGARRPSARRRHRELQRQAGA